MSLGIGPLKKLSLINYFKNIKDIFTVSISELKHIIHSKYPVELIEQRESLLDRAEKEYQKLMNSDIHVINIHCEDYPENLLSIPDPPIVLYYKGTLINDDFNSIAVVGCREATPYGLRNSYKLGEGLANKGITVVSGLARGIDVEAHKGCLNNNGRTIAVLGCGINRYFPKEHQTIQDRIAITGCVISEFPLDTDPRRHHFPMRNRIICGLSVGVVVVEGSRDSGSLYTAQFALDYGRELYAYPGPAQSYHYSGTHDLIKKGARLVENTNDLINDLSLVLDLDLDKNLKKNNILKENKNISENFTKFSEKSIQFDTLNKEELIILKCLSDNEEKSIDYIVEESKLPVEKVLSNLTGLTIKQYCIQKGNYYTLNKIKELK